MKRSITFNIWDEIKQYAETYAKSGRPLPLDDECDKWLCALLQRNDATIPDDAFDFYSGELCALIEQRRAALRSP